ncbi:histone acetyltransferase HAC1-like isoform X2 [Telopea speciosissima]|uniref:histone acetyltransferase HAC1-like isoform X2 n=1 Tax=Telopea speciosissima TaxID=54955 RepID=UPI001CC60E90|nr:histone acetyltransferase HAC1-like isoform X2 [Telopea speciosissima]
MHVQAHMSGQISGQVPNQAGSQMSGLPQPNGNSLPSQTQSLGSFRSTCNMDPEFAMVRKYMRERIYHLFQQRQPTSHEMQSRIPDIVKRLEECLFKTATSKEEYMNMDTLEHRLQALLRRSSAGSHNHYLISSSSSIGTMIPTPGMPSSGSSNATVNSMENSIIAPNACNSVAPNTVNTGSLLTTANGSVGGIHGGSLSNGYQQSPANISICSGGNNMMSSMGVQRIASQMIPTPGLINTQSSMNSESSNNGIGFSSIESTMMSQPLQQKQYIGGQNSRILHSLGSQIGINMRSGLPQKPSSYGFSNGAPNGGLGLMGNNMQLLNGPAASEGFPVASPYGSSPKPLNQHFDPQRQQQLMHTLSHQMIQSGGDVYTMNAADLSGSGNLYGPGTSVGPTINNQSPNPASLQAQSKPSSLNASQVNLEALQQTSHEKPLDVDQSSKMNFQSHQSGIENFLRSHQQMQKFQQQPHQLQQQPFFQHRQKQQFQQQQQQHQQQQLSMRNDGIRQSQLASNIRGQVSSEHGTESHNEILHAQVHEQFQLSELRNQFQQNNATDDRITCAQLLSHPSSQQDFCSSISQDSPQMQQLLHPNQQVVESQNHFSCIPSGAQTEALLQGQWHPQSQGKSRVKDFSSHDQNVQEEFHQRIRGQDEAQRPHLSSEGSITGQISASKNTMVRPTLSDASCRPGNATERRWRNQQRWLLFLDHARACSAPEGKCPEVNCVTVQKLCRHIVSCNVDNCSYPRCQPSKALLLHFRSCRGPECPVCVPVKNILRLNRQAHTRLSSVSGLPNQINGSWKSFDTGDTAKLASKTILSTAETSEDLQSSVKRIKLEHHSPILMPKGESSLFLVSAMSLPLAPQNALTQVCQQVDMSMPVKSEVTEVKTEPFVNSGQRSPNFSEIKKDGLDDSYNERPDEFADLANQESMEVEKEIEQAKQERKQETLPSEQAAGTKSGKPKIKGVSLTELFTPEQIREHIIGLRQWVGQSKAKAEKNQAMERSMSDNSCQLCAVEKLTFEPPPIYCTPCGARIKRNAMYYTMGTGDTRHYFCIPCYNEPRGDIIEVDGTTIPKARLEKKRNDEETEEWWVQCDKCEAWQHQICALFNGRRNDGGQAEYTCPNCYIKEIERGERKPLPQSAVLGAKDLPRTILSDQIEQRLFRRLKQERQERARLLGKSYDEVPGAEALVIRVVSSVDKKLEVKQRFLEIFQEENYPLEFPYKSKVVLLFQKIEGVEVCLFGMYVQEFGAECQFPNQRRVYLSYLDSVKYFRPEVKTVTGEALRTFVYHEILIGYLEYCKKRGFTSCYIWACPPLKGEDYILYCHPEIQKTPKSDKLREWYLSMLRKAAKENIVAELTNLYDHFFVSTGECKAKVTAARLPYFDGDYWPGAAEDIINQLRQEEDGRKQQKKGKTKKTITKRALKAAGHADLSGNASKDVLLMQKLGETICPMKEDFIMVHLQHACTHCCILMVSGNRWVCNQCKHFQLCDKCYETEQRIEEKDRHPINSREKHALFPVEVTDVPSETKDKDEILESEFFDTRQAFLSLCQGNHYQYDTLRRAKHSSMMVLYHLHNPTAPAFVTTCNICHHDIEAGQGWRCEICPDYDVCNACYQKDCGVDHPHKLTNHPSIAERDAQNTEARQKRVIQLRKMLDLLVHASQCRSPQCQYPNCRKVKGLFRHGIQCKTRASGGCLLCKKMWYLLQLHARACKESECHVPRCKDLKEHLRRLQQQSDSRRRAAVMEMMRQRAAEVAGSTG